MRWRFGGDYDVRAAFESSANYSLREYTDDLVQTIGEVYAEAVPHPNIVSESGRAIAAHHSVLVVQVFGANSNASNRFKYGEDEYPLVDAVEDPPQPWRSSKLTAYHNALNCKEDAYNMFALGALELEVKAKVETLLWEICDRVLTHFRQSEGYVPEEIATLKIK